MAAPTDTTRAETASVITTEDVVNTALLAPVSAFTEEPDTALLTPPFARADHGSAGGRGGRWSAGGPMADGARPSPSPAAAATRARAGRWAASAGGWR